MKNIKTLSIIATFIFITLFFQNAKACNEYEIEWDSKYGGTNYDDGYFVQNTSDGGYILIGSTSSFNVGKDIWLIKTNEKGDEEWNKTFGGFGNDYGRCIRQTSDYGFILIGKTSLYGAGSYDIWLIKTDSNGNETWNRTYGGQNWDEGFNVHQTNDGGYILLGYTSSYGNGLDDIWLIKTDSNGNETWNKTFGGSGYDYGESFQITNDSGFIITGQKWKDTSSDVWLIKTDKNGDEIWNKTYGNPGLSESGNSVQQTDDQGFIILGWTKSHGDANGDIWLIKTNKTGDKTWDKTYGGKDIDEGLYVLQTSEEGYILSTYKGVNDNSSGYAWIILTDKDGNILWDKRLKSDSDGDFIRCIQKIQNNSYILTGSTDEGSGLSDVWLIKLRPIIYKEIDTTYLYPMLIIALTIAVIFCIPIALYWRKRYYS